MAKIALNGTGIHAIIRQFVTAAMPQHMRVDFRVKAGRSGRAFHHGLETTLSALTRKIRRAIWCQIFRGNRV